MLVQQKQEDKRQKEEFNKEKDRVRKRIKNSDKVWNFLYDFDLIFFCVVLICNDYYYYISFSFTIINNLTIYNINNNWIYKNKKWF